MLVLFMPRPRRTVPGWVSVACPVVVKVPQPIWMTPCDEPRAVSAPAMVAFALPQDSPSLESLAAPSAETKIRLSEVAGFSAYRALDPGGTSQLPSPRRNSLVLSGNGPMAPWALVVAA